MFSLICRSQKQKQNQTQIQRTSGCQKEGGGDKTEKNEGD